MAEGKRQHYVPKFYLKNFSPDPAGRMINLFNFEAEKTILRASLRDQCYKDYFYGADLAMEKGLGLIETETSNLFKSIIETQRLSDDPDTTMYLCMFSIVQFLRTAAAAFETNKMMDAMAKKIHRGQFDDKSLDTLRISMIDAPGFNIRNGILLFPICFDLQMAILVNGSNLEFITSDNPTALVNKFWQHKFHGSGSHLAAAGLLIVIPISPRHTILLYDRGVYSAPKDGGNKIQLNRADDVRKLNEIQLLRAFENIYFSDSSQSPLLETQFRETKERRRSSHVEINELVPGSGPGVYVRPTSIEDLSNQGRTLLMTERLGIDIDLRFSFLKLRSKPRYYDDGSAAGAQRDPSWVAIVRDFSRAAEQNKWELGSIDQFARFHPRWQSVGPWKRRLFGH